MRVEGQVVDDGGDVNGCLVIEHDRLAERRRIPELAAAHDEITATKRERNRAVIKRAIDRGELRADADPELVIDMYVSPVLYRFLVTDLPLDDKFASSVVDTVVRAFR